ncbi:PAS domain S-box-containing protein [Natronocella acetinitrilica]|uniref:PAS domain S-box-containing protein n=1 Tax=Natronocella acetinitrilica TaxID=414046 RepID=A0AAE3G5K3_9GAMM|nr:PAS domain S-box protein [Natronocella acetinitrilica]MCP1675533.1 PAS domain S-box-containing protein [Natronocella acetinitrilica]
MNAFVSTSLNDVVGPVSHDVDLADLVFAFQSEALLALDTDGRIVRTNRAFDRLWGGKSESMPGRSAVELFPAHDQDRVRRWMKRLHDDGALTCPVAITRAGGRAIQVQLEWLPVPPGGWLMLRDHTLLGALEQQLSESELRFRSTFDYAAVGMAIVALPDGELLRCNDVLCNLLGHSQAGMRGRRYVDLLFADDRGPFLNAVARLARGSERQGLTLEQRCIAREGDIRWVLSSLAVLRSAFGQAQYLVVQLQDLTGRKDVERKLEESRQELQRLYAAMESVRENEQKRISRELHDELGQALTALKMDIAWLQARRDPGLAEDAREKLTRMLGLVDRTAEGIRRLAGALRPGVLDDFGLAAAAEWLVKEYEESAGVQVDLHLGQEEFALGDVVATAVFRILQEALTNIARHAQADRVAVRLVLEGEMLCLEVRDDGRGFDPEQAGLLESYGLLGMRERVKLLDGVIEINSEPGLGTRITVRVPATTVDPSEESS